MLINTCAERRLANIFNSSYSLTIKLNKTANKNAHCVIGPEPVQWANQPHFIKIKKIKIKYLN